jgi:hypothetical protein
LLSSIIYLFCIQRNLGKKQQGSRGKRTLRLRSVTGVHRSVTGRRALRLRSVTGRRALRLRSVTGRRALRLRSVTGRRALRLRSVTGAPHQILQSTITGHLDTSVPTNRDGSRRTAGKNIFSVCTRRKCPSFWSNPSNTDDTD